MTKPNSLLRVLLIGRWAWLVGLALLVLGAACSSGPPQKAAAGDMAPDFSLPTVAGETASLSQAKGQVAIVTFWRTD